MQQRFHVAWLGNDFTHAVEVKNVFVKEYPEINFQIRKRANNNFQLVKRLSVADATEVVSKSMYTKKKKKKNRGWKLAANQKD